MRRGTGQCKHQLQAGCVYCHGSRREVAELNRQTSRVKLRRLNRAIRYEAKVEQAMHQEGSLWRAVARPPQYSPMRRSLAVHTMGYNGA